MGIKCVDCAVTEAENDLIIKKPMHAGGAHIEVSKGGNNCNIFLNYCKNHAGVSILQHIWQIHDWNSKNCTEVTSQKTIVIFKFHQI